MLVDSLKESKDKKHRNRLLIKLNTKLGKYKLRGRKEDEKSRNSPLIKLGTFIVKVSPPQSVQPSEVVSRNNSPVRTSINLPPVGRLGVQNFPSFIEHRKKLSFTTILKWDHDKKKQVRQKIWLKPENSMKEIMNSDRKRLENQEMGEVTMITLGINSFFFMRKL